MPARSSSVVRHAAERGRPDGVAEVRAYGPDMPSSPSAPPLDEDRLERERLARMERVAAELRALARQAQGEPAGPTLHEAAHHWSRMVDAARRRLRARVEPGAPDGARR